MDRFCFRYTSGARSRRIKDGIASDDDWSGFECRFAKLGLRFRCLVVGYWEKVQIKGQEEERLISQDARTLAIANAGH